MAPSAPSCAAVWRSPLQKLREPLGRCGDPSETMAWSLLLRRRDSGDRILKDKPPASLQYKERVGGCQSCSTAEGRWGGAAGSPPDAAGIPEASLDLGTS